MKSWNKNQIACFIAECQGLPWYSPFSPSAELEERKTGPGQIHLPHLITRGQPSFVHEKVAPETTKPTIVIIPSTALREFLLTSEYSRYLRALFFDLVEGIDPYKVCVWLGKEGLSKPMTFYRELAELVSDHEIDTPEAEITQALAFGGMGQANTMLFGESALKKFLAEKEKDSAKSLVCFEEESEPSSLRYFDMSIPSKRAPSEQKPQEINLSDGKKIFSLHYVSLNEYEKSALLDAEEIAKRMPTEPDLKISYQDNSGVVTVLIIYLPEKTEPEKPEEIIEHIFKELKIDFGSVTALAMKSVDELGRLLRMFPHLESLELSLLLGYESIKGMCYPSLHHLNVQYHHGEDKDLLQNMGGAFPHLWKLHLGHIGTKSLCYLVKLKSLRTVDTGLYAVPEDSQIDLRELKNLSFCKFEFWRRFRDTLSKKPYITTLLLPETVETLQLRQTIKNQRVRTSIPQRSVSISLEGNILGLDGKSLIIPKGVEQFYFNPEIPLEGITHIPDLSTIRFLGPHIEKLSLHIPAKLDVFMPPLVKDCQITYTADSKDSESKTWGGETTIIHPFPALATKKHSSIMQQLCECFMFSNRASADVLVYKEDDSATPLPNGERCLEMQSYCFGYRQFVDSDTPLLSKLTLLLHLLGDDTIMIADLPLLESIIFTGSCLLKITFFSITNCPRLRLISFKDGFLYLANNPKNKENLERLQTELPNLLIEYQSRRGKHRIKLKDVPIGWFFGEMMPANLVEGGATQTVETRALTQFETPSPSPDCPAYISTKSAPQPLCALSSPMGKRATFGGKTQRTLLFFKGERPLKLERHYRDLGGMLLEYALREAINISPSFDDAPTRLQDLKKVEYQGDGKPISLAEYQKRSEGQDVILYQYQMTPVFSEEFYPLPTQTASRLGSMSLPIITDSSGKILNFKTYWCEETKQYIIQIPREYRTIPSPFTIHYVHQESFCDTWRVVTGKTKLPSTWEERLIEKLAGAELFKRETLLTPAWIELLKRCVLDDHCHLVFLRPFLDTEQKPNPEELASALYQLARLLNTFTDEALTKPLQGREQIRGWLIEQKGVCRNQAILAYLFLRFLGIKTKLCVTEIHAFCEVEIAGEAFIFPLVSQALPIIDQRDYASVKPEQIASTAAVVVAPAATAVSPTTPAVSSAANAAPATPVTGSVPTSEMVSSAIPALLIPAGSRNRCVVMEDHQNPFAEAAKIFALCEKAGTPTVYIHSAQTLRYLLNPYHVTADHQRMPLPRENNFLWKIIREGGLVVMNWDNFSSIERRQLMGMIDDAAILQGEPISTKTTIVGLMTKETRKKAGSTFTSRCRFVLLPGEDKFQIKDKGKRVIQEPIKVDLKEHYDWFQKLMAKIKMDLDGTTLIEGPLWQAIRENRQIELINPPDDPELMELLESIKYLGYFIYNAERHRAPRDLFLETIVEPLPKDHPRLEIYDGAQETTPDLSSAFLLHPNNWYQLFHLERLNADGGVHTAPGLLARAHRVFLVSEKISNTNLALLIDFLNDLPDEEKVKFILLPEATMGDKTGTPAKERQDIRSPQTPHAIKTHDAICYLAELTKIPTVIHLSDQESYGSLLEQTAAGKDKETALVHQGHELLAKLQAGEEVILVGRPNAELYVQLLPFLSNPPRAVINGELVQLSGRLTLIVPEDYAAHFAHIEERKYGAADYRRILISQGYEAKQVDLLLKTFEQLKAWRASLLPDERLLPVDLMTLQTLLEELRQADKKGAHNPLKGWAQRFGLNKDSLMYRASNVLCKYRFGTGEKRGVSGKKLVTLAETFDLKITQDPFALLREFHETHQKNPESMQAFIWAWLNCFRQDALRALLEEDFEAILVQGADKPQIKPEVIQKWLSIKKDALHITVDLSPTNKAKLVEQVSSLLRKKEMQVIHVEGETGAGKSYFVDHLPGIKLFKSSRAETDDEVIKAWLAYKGDEPALLHLEEANTRTLRPLNAYTLYIDGVFYHVPPGHHIVTTSNPHGETDRSSPETWKSGVTLFKPALSIKTQKEILLSLLPEEYPHRRKIISFIFNKIYPILSAAKTPLTLTLRDLKELVLLFRAKLGENPTTDLNDQALLVTIAASFCRSYIHRPEEKARVQKALYQLIGKDFRPSALACRPIDRFFIPSGMRYFDQTIEDMLILRKQALKNPDLALHKRGLLIRGPSGLGKSSLLRALLKEEGLTVDAEVPQNKVYVLTPDMFDEEDENGFQKTMATFKEALASGGIIIIDELNAARSKTLQTMLNSLLGQDAADIKIHSGAMIFATQNDGFEEGCGPQSLPLLNRFHLLNVEEPAASDLAEAATYYGVRDPDKKAKEFLEAKTKGLGEGHYRHFWQSLNPMPEGIKATAGLSGAGPA